MRDRVNEAVVLLIATNFADQKNRIQHQPGNDGEKKDRTQNEFDFLAPVEDDPADVQCGGRHHQAYA